MQVVKESSQTKPATVHKHVSRACLECRSRHLKCGGQEPKCERCNKNDRPCTYVKSHRGGSRKKGVYTSKITKSTSAKSSIGRENEIGLNSNQMNRFQASSSASSSSAISSDIQSNKRLSDMLPCVKNGLGHLSDGSNCTQQCMQIENYNKMPECLSSAIVRHYRKPKKINYHPLFNGSKDDEPINIVFDDSKLVRPLENCYISPALIKDFNVNSIISRYYNNFHSAHPFLPSQDYILTYLDSIPLKYDILLAMKIMGEGQTTNKYAKDVETINFLSISLISYIRQIGKDFISLQSLLLIAMITHISSLHDLSTLIRETAISLALELKLNYIDEFNVPDVFLDVNGFITDKDPSCTSPETCKNYSENLFKSERTKNIPYEILIETARKTFWELYYFDSISGTASGHTKSKLALETCLVLYPKSLPLSKFDYKSRAEACKLVNDAISLNIAIESNSDPQPHLNHMRAALGNWDMKLANPETYGTPYLIDQFGIVNDGVFEAIMLLNYARIFTHRPFSYLWKSDVSKHAKCTGEEEAEEQPIDKKQKPRDSRKIIETRKTIDSANFLMKTLLDCDPGQTCKRTPFLACALAFSCLVHLSAYSWVEANVSSRHTESPTDVASSELDVYTEYIKLEIGSTLQISRHWSLSSKLVVHISETLATVSPKLYKKVQAGILGLGFNLADMSELPPLNSRKEENVTKTERSISEERLMSRAKTSNGEMNLFPSYPVHLDVNRASSDSKVISNRNTTSFYPINESPNLSNQLNSFESSQVSQTPSEVVSDIRPNNFMMEFNDLMNNMNQLNSTDRNSAATSLGFSTDSPDFGFFDPLSPTSDTGCDWVDKHAFQFDAFAANEF
ncbi:hypothetical protein CANINC_000845 [Pichia inconspicua]|uniref:Zn(2)-C6 fungal-type domain-containing protein n=1 Tax=Pichia inconspicua TaxID=52247 RepID=A0A4T0X665_9ASCO|nr:hypothetical protein CANINC_000845 [[Candida] inconspicua]